MLNEKKIMVSNFKLYIFLYLSLDPVRKQGIKEFIY